MQSAYMGQWGPGGPVVLVTVTVTVISTWTSDCHGAAMAHIFEIFQLSGVKHIYSICFR